MWRSCNEWSQADKDKHNKEARETNKAWGENTFNYVEKYGWPKIIHQFTLKILFLIKNLLKVTLFSVKIL